MVPTKKNNSYKAERGRDDHSPSFSNVHDLLTAGLPQLFNPLQSEIFFNGGVESFSHFSLKVGTIE